ncbi:MAG TPA: hypothetical protein VLI46_02345 [Ramlibacter sp.]|nr:hypothetical protein [Ramlibacter sp.]
MRPDSRVQPFDDCLAQWRAADEQALQSELRLSNTLDLYVEGQGAAPSAAAIAQTRQLRQAAREELKFLLGCLDQARSRLPLI